METIIQNDLFTVSSNKVIRDRSYLDEIWRCVAVTETQIWAKSATGRRAWTGDKPVCLIKAEHDFYRCPQSTLEAIANAMPVDAA